MSASGAPQARFSPAEQAELAAPAAGAHELGVYAGTYTEGAVCVALGCSCGWSMRYPDGITLADLKAAAWADHAER